MVTFDMVTEELRNCIVECAPVRQFPKGATKYSPYPGNLKNNGIRRHVYGNSGVVVIGGAPAVYAGWVDIRGKSAGYIDRGIENWLARMQALGGKVK